MDIYITKGITNPNYPGFQKFAHTLSDDYIEYSDMECNESDLTDSDREDDPTFPSKMAKESGSETFKNGQDSILSNCDNGNTYISEEESVNRSENIPDIVNENYSATSENSKRALQKPDLIYNLSQNYTTNPEFPSWSCTINSKYEGQLQGQSPIDIVGDFGGEVEREFELLLTGYKNKKEADELKGSNLDKICDAELSNGTEALKQTSSTRLSGNSTRKNKKKNTPYGHQIVKTKHPKPSHDERQLPPDTFDYKTYSQRKYIICDADQYSSVPEKNKNDSPNLNQAEIPNMSSLEIGGSGSQQNLDEDNNKVASRKYSNQSRWSQYLEDPIKYSKDPCSTMVLEQFDAYKIANDMDVETLQNHYKKVKQIEKKRRFNRDEIRKRLAIGDKDSLNNDIKKEEFLTGSDNESYSSDSETCPKLSSGVLRKQSEFCETKRNKEFENDKIFQKNQINQDKSMNHMNGNPIGTTDYPSDENLFFFANQSKLQIEVRIALAQSKEIAQMKVKARKHGVTPIVDVIRSMLCDVGIKMNSNHRWISRQLLTGIQVPTLQLLVNNLQEYIENLNVTLLESLKERDDLNSDQDDILHDLEKINNFFVFQQQSGQQVNKIVRHGHLD
uniref:Schwannomin-interacting protein 1 homolog n=2 Tax=Drosophila melanogaster TaxID=7227 RepID=SCHI1_DROME|nr:schwannomin interacting protein 1, isoform B [Drosophila melanogaster]A8DYY6.1 RecName: Full=Schwannomin-interacting protein 1 homolog [Drosophila melanogaster]ABV53662.1 schwannomin interacting protein 1, isoform B [Drosophila melanogaster]|eukprot:NP_001097139.1 schwannomin interacting protein 1, isoform B [Drosophila melanogaster]